MVTATSFITLCLAATAAARKCRDIVVPVHISARNGVFDVAPPATNIEATDFILDNLRQGHDYANETLTGYRNVSGTYKLQTTYCEPDSGPSGTVQLLTHGIAFDRTYWDFPAHDHKYSYTAVAVDEYRYSTLAWDRLGIGMSQHGEPVNEIQSTLEIAALKALTLMLRHGQIPGVGCAFSKVVHVGHSFGSIQSYSLTVTDPELSDGLVLTGFSQDPRFLPYFGYGGNFVVANTIPALAQYPAGYLAGGDVSAAQTNFFAPGEFDPDILNVAASTSQPVTVGEMLTIGGSTALVNHFEGPVLIITGGELQQ